MTTILALDSSSENCSVAVYHEHTVTLRSKYAPRQHTQLILPLLKQELESRNVVLADIDAIAFGCGPGSFTGIRIAAGVAQGLAFGLNIPIYAISNLQALALQSYLENGVSQVLACIDARMGEVYWGLFQVSSEKIPYFDSPEQHFMRYTVNPMLAEQVCSPEHVSVCFMEQAKNLNSAGIGSGLNMLPPELLQSLSQIDTESQPNADAVAYLADTAKASGLVGDMQDALPSYVRDTVTWNKLPGRE